MKTNIICSNYISGLRNQGKIDSKILSENLTEDQEIITPAHKIVGSLHPLWTFTTD